MSTLDAGERFDGRKTGVLSKGHGDSIESVGKGSHGILFETRGCNCCIFNCEGARNFGGTTSINYSVVTDKISYDTESIVERAFGFVDNLKLC